MNTEAKTVLDRVHTKLTKQKLSVWRQICNNPATFVKHVCNLFVCSTTLPIPVAGHFLIVAPFTTLRPVSDCTPRSVLKTWI
jgi:hypothetical protein